MGDNVSFNTALHNAALECALKRRNKQCKNKFDSMVCNRCQWYVKKYIDAEPNKVALFMLQKEIEADAMHIRNNAHHPIFATVLIVFLGLALLSYLKTDKPWENKYASNYKAETAASDAQKVKNTMELVAKDLRKKVDVNHDGLINCIDAAVLFYQYYPGQCYITINQHPPFNHLFNTVWINDAWRCIEPAATYNGWSSFYLKELYPKDYDSSYNVGATEDYKTYARVLK